MKQNRRVFLRNTALAGGAITLRGLAGAQPSSANSGASSSGTGPEDAASALLRREFQSPPKKYRPLVRWWWPGNDVMDDELRREIGVLDEAGIGGAEIQPFVKGFNPNSLPAAQRERVQSYATPSFFRHVAVAIEEARGHGLFIDYTFGSGWPFGGGMAITPELASIELRWTHCSVEGPAKFQERVQVPAVTDGDLLRGSSILDGLPEGWAERMKKRTRVEAVVAVRGEDAEWNGNRGGRSRILARTGQLDASTAVNLTSSLAPDGTLTWDVPEGMWQLFVFCSAPTVQRVNAGAGPGPQLVMDHLSAAAFAAHAERVGGNAVPYIGKYFGDGLRAIFCDSLEVAAYLFWSGDFLAEFRRRRGYDLWPYLPILKVETNAEPYGRFVDRPIFDVAEGGDQVRHDYRQTVSDLIIERFYEQFNRWAHEHKLLSRTQAHGAPADVLRIYGETDIPETETLYDQGGYDFLKMAASSAHVYRRAIVGSESFVWQGALYQTTPEKMKLAADELLTAGINAILYHGFPYLMAGVPAPGWHPFTGVYSGCYSSQLNEMNTFWPYLARLNAYIARVQYISQTGTNIAPVALYHYDVAHGAVDVPPTPPLNQSIMDAGYNYDQLNTASLLDCAVQDRALVTAAGARYSVLVVPPSGAISEALAGKLVSFAAGGLPIVFAGQVPSQDRTFPGRERRSQAVQSAMQKLRAFSNVSFASGSDEAVAMLGKAASPNIRFHSAPLPFIQKRIGGVNTYFLRNASDAKQHLHAEFDAEGQPELWDPWTGRFEGVVSRRRNGRWVEAELDLEPFASALVVFDPAGAAIPVTPALRLVRSEPVGAGSWKLTAAGLVASGETAVIHRDLSRLIDWSLDSELRGFSGRGTYAASFTVSQADLKNRLILDLGGVKDVAEVTVNGKSAATLLLRPYSADITNFVRPGENLLEIAVTNALFNAMALRKPRTFNPGDTANPSGLMSAGLLGPVQLKWMT